MLAAAWRSSASTNVQPRSAASARPTVLFPAPAGPMTITTIGALPFYTPVMHVRCAVHSARVAVNKLVLNLLCSSTVGRRTLVAAFAVGLVAITGWVTSADYRGVVPDGDYAPRRIESLTLTGSDAAAKRLDALARASFDAPLDWAPAYPLQHDPLARPVPACRFLPSEASGTTAKFDCVFEG